MKSLTISKNKFRGPFSLFHTLNSDQCSSDQWISYIRGSYSTVININKKWIKINLQETERELILDLDKEFSNSEIEILKEKLFYWFWADYDLLDFYSKFAKEKYIGKIFPYCYGTRVMRDIDPVWRIMESICTQNSSVKQIRLMEDLLCRHYGNQISFDDGTVFYSFPSIEKLAMTKEEELKEKCRVGYRANYIINVAREILKGNLDPFKLMKMSTEEARKILMSIKGIGPKVADLILLYGFGKPDTFPMDVWLKRALSRIYFKNEKVPEKGLREFALDYFGRHSGIAHLYIFYYERKKKQLANLIQQEGI